MSDYIVVGVDGSSQSLQALEWGVDEALRRRLPLRIVHIAVHWQYDIADPAEPGLDAPRPEAAGLMVLEAAQNHALDLAPGLDVSTRLGIGPIAATLLQETGDAALLVLGARGIEGSRHMTLGSVTRQAAEHARCPVLVVAPKEHDPRPRRREVVVGVDGSEASRDAVAFAIEEASLRKIGLLAVHAWTHPAYPHQIRPVRYDEAAVSQEGGRLLSESLAGWTAKYPDVPVIEQVVRGRPADVLAEDSRTAELLVVGATGRGGFAGLYLGSVSHAVLHHAQGPIAVVRPGGTTDRLDA